MSSKLISLGAVLFLMATAVTASVALLLLKRDERLAIAGPSSMDLFNRRYACAEIGRRRAEAQDRSDTRDQEAMLPHTFVVTTSRYCYNETRQTCLYSGARTVTRSTSAGLTDVSYRAWIEDLLTNDTVAAHDRGASDGDTPEAFARKQRLLMACLPSEGEGFR